MSEIPDIIWDDFEMPPGFSLDEQNTMFGFITEARQTETHTVDKKEAIEVLKTLPGLDPVLAVVDGYQEDIPAQGWIVYGKIAPGYGGVINLYKYREGGLALFSFKDMREEYGQATAHFDLKRAGSYAVSYENPNFPQKSMEPYNRMSTASYLPTNFASLDIIDLECSGRILSQKAALEGFGGTLFFEMRWEDLDKRGERMREVDISRATDNEDGLLKIVAQLGYSMGMDNEGLQKIVACVKAKVSTNTRP